jgi:hypothetical protein
LQQLFNALFIFNFALNFKILENRWAESEELERRRKRSLEVLDVFLRVILKFVDDERDLVLIKVVFQRKKLQIAKIV